MSDMHFCQLRNLFRKQEIRMDPGNDKKMKHLQDVPDSCVAKNSYLEHRRHYLLSIAVESNSPILGPAKFSK